MWKIEEEKVTWLSPWLDSSWRLTQPLLGSGRQRDPFHPPALQDPACLPYRGWTDPESCPSPPQSHIPLNHISIPITLSTSCPLGPPPLVRIVIAAALYFLDIRPVVTNTISHNILREFDSLHLVQMLRRRCNESRRFHWYFWPNLTQMSKRMKVWSYDILNLVGLVSRRIVCIGPVLLKSCSAALLQAFLQGLLPHLCSATNSSNTCCVEGLLLWARLVF